MISPNHGDANQYLQDAPSGDFQSVAFHKSYLTMQLPKAPEETELSTPPANLALVCALLLAT